MAKIPELPSDSLRAISYFAFLFHTFLRTKSSQESFDAQIHERRLRHVSCRGTKVLAFSVWMKE